MVGDDGAEVSNCEDGCVIAPQDGLSKRCGQGLEGADRAAERVLDCLASDRQCEKVNEETPVAGPLSVCYSTCPVATFQNRIVP